MRSCPTCGAPNAPGDDFCGNCGAYLGWSDDANAAPAPGASPAPSAEPAPPPAPAEPGTGMDAGTASGPDPAAGPAPRTSSARRRLPGQSRWRTPGREPGAAESWQPAAVDTAAGAVGPPPAPGTGTDAGTGSGTGVSGGRTPPPEAEPEAVLPVQPAKPVAPRPVPRAAPVPEEAVGPPCPACGTPNPPGRRFCRRCANPLFPSQAAARRSWWRGLRPSRRRVRAGSGRVLRLLVILLVVAALAVAGFLGAPTLHTLYEDTLDKIIGAKAVTPLRPKASESLPSHPASATIDGISNRYWGVRSAGAWITYTFDKPIRLVNVIILNGAGPDGNGERLYESEARARRIDMTVTEKDGTRHEKTIFFTDKAAERDAHVPMAYSDVTSVRLVLSEVTPLAPGRHVAIAEVEFFRRG